MNPPTHSAADSPARECGNPRAGKGRRNTALPRTSKGARITGRDRLVLTRELKKRYEAGASIRALAEETGRAYGTVHGLLVESAVTFRSRGGDSYGRSTTRGGTEQDE